MLSLLEINRELSRLGRLERKEVNFAEKFEVRDDGQILLSRADNAPIGINSSARMRRFLAENLGVRDFYQVDSQ